MPLPPDAGREVALAAVTGALSLVDPAELAPRRRAAYRLTCAALTGAFAFDALKKDEALADRAEARVAVGIGAAGAVLASMGVWERWDGRLHRWLLARGVARPRLVIAAAAAATSLASAVLESRVARAAEQSEQPEQPEPPADPVP